MIHILDTHYLGRAGIIAATALQTSEGFALFDTGPESTFQNIVTELAGLGLRASDIRHVFLSHIHLDHAGAAWRLAELGAKIYVHPRGATHLADPSRLIESATRIFGDMMDVLWGRISPIAPQQIVVLHDGDRVRLGQLTITAVETPGHALHHHAYHWADNLFGGDVAGVKLKNGPSIPPFVPPELDITAWLGSIQKMRALDVRQLYLPHFGLVSSSIPAHFDELAERVQRWAEWFRERLDSGQDQSALTRAFAEYQAADFRHGGAAENQLADYEAADPSYMAVTAALRYWRKQGVTQRLSH